MNQLDIQIMDAQAYAPSCDMLQSWVDAALCGYGKETELVIRLVTEQEMAGLNKIYRQKRGGTNILSFPAEIPEYIQSSHLGDLVVCAAIVNAEARQQHKAPDDHWAHIIIHGVLHLLGFDHIEDSQAEHMESEEIRILEQFEINNPYHEKQNNE